MLAAVKEAWLPLRSQWLGERVLLSFDDSTLRGVGLRKGAISTPPWESMLPARALAQGMPEQIDVLGDFLGDLMLSLGLSSQPLRIALPAAAAHWRVLEWPLDAWPDDPIEALRTINPDLGLPFALAEANIDLQPLAKQPGAPLQALLVAAPRALVEAWVSVFDLAGLVLERLVPAQVCLRTALLPALQQLDPAAGVMLLLPEPEGSCLVQLWQQGLPRYERRLMLNQPDLPDQLHTLLAFYSSRHSRFALRHLWTAAPFAQQDQVAATLRLPLEPLEPSAYDSMVLEGLAQVR